MKRENAIMIDDDALREHPPKEAIEMSESETEEKGNTISIPNDKSNRQRIRNYNEKNELMNKGKQQEQTIIDLHEYIELLEKKIALLDSKQLVSFTNNINQYAQSDLAIIKKENNTLHQKSKELLIIIDQLKRDHLTVINANLVYQNDNNTLKSQMIELQHMIEKSEQIRTEYSTICNLNIKCNEDKIALLKDIEILKKEINKKDSDINEYQSVIKQIEFQHQGNIDQIVYEELSKADIDFNSRITELTNIIQDKDTQIYSLKAEMLLIENELLKYQSLSKHIESRYNNLSAEFQTQSEINLSYLQSSYQSITELKTKEGKLIEELIKANDTINNIKKESNDYENNYNISKENYDNLNNRFNTVNESNYKLKRLNEELNESKHFIEVQYNKLLSEFKLIQDDNNKVVNKIKKENEEINKSNIVLNEENNRLKIENNVFNETNKRQLIEINTLQTTMKEVKSEKDVICLYNTNLELQINELKQAIQLNKTELDEIKDQLQEMTVNYNKLKQNNDNLINETTKLTNEIRDYHNSLKDRDKQLKIMVNGINKNKDKLLENKIEIFNNPVSIIDTQNQCSPFLENYIIVNNFISKLIEGIITMKNTKEEFLTKLSELTIVKDKLDKENQEYVAKNDDLLLKIVNLNTEITSKDKTIHKEKKERDMYASNMDKLNTKINQLTMKYQKKKQMSKEIKDTNQNLNKVILLYENVKKRYEDMIIQMTQYKSYSHDLTSLTKNYIQANYDLIQMERNTEYCIGNYSKHSKDNNLNTSESKLKEVECLHNSLLNEFKTSKILTTNQSLLDTQSNYYYKTTTTSCNALMKNKKSHKIAQELSESIGKLRSSYLDYKMKCKK